MDWTKIVWLPKTLMSSLLDMVLIWCQGLGSWCSCFLFWFSSNLMVALSNSVSSTNTGLILSAKLESPLAGDLGNSWNLFVHLLICSIFTMISWMGYIIFRSSSVERINSIRAFHQRFSCFLKEQEVKRSIAVSNFWSRQAQPSAKSIVPWHCASTKFDKWGNGWSYGDIGNYCWSVHIHLHDHPLHSVPESLYSFRFRFLRISVFCNKKLKKNREIAEFIANQLRFHEKNFR